MDHRDHDLTKVNEINNDNTETTSYIISNFEESTSLNNIPSAKSYVSHYTRIRRNRRKLRKRTDTLCPFRRLPIQVTNDPFVNNIFNGSSFC